MTRGCSPWLRAMVTVEPTSTSWRSPPCSQANITPRTRVHRVPRTTWVLVLQDSSLGLTEREQRVSPEIVRGGLRRRSRDLGELLSGAEQGTERVALLGQP